MRALVRSGKSARRRTVPYLGIACLALLALSGVYAAPELAALGESPVLGLPAFTWLDERATEPGNVRRLATRLGSRVGAVWTRWAGWVGTSRAAHAPCAAHVSQPTPRARGALALPALLIAVALARTH
ncbi:MAG TPA: hypothetical protein VJN88_07075 [Ktedonobacterales bacterium]|nr:hypothetical protein [Ktedonobacterales bacterium]